MTRAFVFQVARVPIRDAAEMRADRADGDELVLVRLKIDQPETFGARRRFLEALVDAAGHGELFGGTDAPEFLGFLEGLRPEEILEHCAEGRANGGDRAPCDDEGEIEIAAGSFH